MPRTRHFHPIEFRLGEIYFFLLKNELIFTPVNEFRQRKVCIIT